MPQKRKVAPRPRARKASTNPWIAHVQAYRGAHKCTYREALVWAKASYRSAYAETFTEEPSKSPPFVRGRTHTKECYRTRPGDRFEVKARMGITKLSKGVFGMNKHDNERTLKLIASGKHDNGSYRDVSIRYYEEATCVGGVSYGNPDSSPGMHELYQNVLKSLTEDSNTFFIPPDVGPVKWRDQDEVKTFAKAMLLLIVPMANKSVLDTYFRNVYRYHDYLTINNVRDSPGMQTATSTEQHDGMSILPSDDQQRMAANANIVAQKRREGIFDTAARFNQRR